MVTKNNIKIQFTRNYWEQKISYLLNKINEFIDEQSINYEIAENKELLILKLKYNSGQDSLNLINQLINIL